MAASGKETGTNIRGREYAVEQNKRQSGPMEEAEMQELERRACRLGKAGDFGPEAMSVNSRIIKQDPYNTYALIRRGRCHLEHGRGKAACRDFGQVLRREPSNAVARKAFDRVGRYETPVRVASECRHDVRPREAADLYEWVVSRRGLAYEKTGLAAAYTDLGYYHDALNLVDEVLDEDPHDEYATNVRDKVLAALGHAS